MIKIFFNEAKREHIFIGDSGIIFSSVAYFSQCIFDAFDRESFKTIEEAEEYFSGHPDYQEWRDWFVMVDFSEEVIKVIKVAEEYHNKDNCKHAMMVHESKLKNEPSYVEFLHLSGHDCSGNWTQAPNPEAKYRVLAIVKNGITTVITHKKHPAAPPMERLRQFYHGQKSNAEWSQSWIDKQMRKSFNVSRRMIFSSLIECEAKSLDRKEVERCLSGCVAGKALISFVMRAKEAELISYKDLLDFKAHIESENDRVQARFNPPPTQEVE